LVAHFHNVIIGGSLFGYFAGLTYWWPKATGFTLDERLGKWACGLWTVGFFMAFMPLYVLGFMGMTRRLNYYDNPVWNNWLLVAGAGAIIVLCAIGVQFYQMFASIRDQKNNRDWSGDPWDGRTLEWATSSPPPFYNFALLPNVRDRDHWADMKEQSLAYKIPEQYQRIHMPKNTWAGVVIGGASLAFGFAMVWWIWWMAILSSAAMLAAWIVYAFSDGKDYYVEVDEILAIEQKRYANLSRTNEKPLEDGEVDAVTISV
jgi:cytochrome o ubiquinol oxidase subunit 1